MKSNEILENLMKSMTIQWNPMKSGDDDQDIAYRRCNSRKRAATSHYEYSCKWNREVEQREVKASRVAVHAGDRLSKRPEHFWGYR